MCNGTEASDYAGDQVNMGPMTFFLLGPKHLAYAGQGCSMRYVTKKVFLRPP
jgi:hypothetical protein